MAARVFWILVIGFLSGVAMRSFTVFGFWTIAFFLLVSGVVLVFGLLSRKHFSSSVLATLCISVVALGALRMQVALFESEPALDVWIGEKVVFEGVVFDEPDVRENNIRIPVRVETIASTSVERFAAILVIAPLHTNVAYGDRVRVQGKLALPESFDTGGGHFFNYPAFLAKEGIGYQMSFAHVEYVGESDRNAVKAAAIWIKKLYLFGLGQSLPEPAAGLAGGITAGDKQGLGSEVSERFRTVGLTHIVVLSGYNIMIVLAFIEYVFARTPLGVRLMLGGTVAVFFAVMTGFASSSVRAASMALIASLGKASGRTYLASRALGLVAFGMVLVNPYVLTFDPGFQLSILATFGLIAIAPQIAAHLSAIPEKFQLREITAVTLGTQVAVLPLILYQSGALSVYTLPANILALAVVPYAMLFSFIAGVCGLFLGPLAPLVGLPAYLLLSYILLVAELFSSLPFALFTIPPFVIGSMALAYAFLGVLLMIRIKKAGVRPASRTIL